MTIYLAYAILEYMSNEPMKHQKSELEKFKLFFEETPVAYDVTTRLRRTK